MKGRHFILSVIKIVKGTMRFFSHRSIKKR